MNKFYLTIGMLLLGVTISSAQTTAKEHVTGKKAEKVQNTNNNPANVNEETPADLPVLNFGGDQDANFYEYIQQKTQWFANNPSYLTDKKFLTRISKSYKESLPTHIQTYIDQHAAEFDVVGK